MTKLDDAILKHMQYIVDVEGRPFSYKDFLNFQIHGLWYSVAHGTFRNKISVWIKSSIVELCYNSKISFYTLKGRYFGSSNTMTRNHMGIPSVIPVTPVIPYTAINEAINFLNYLKTLDTNTNSIHDIHTKFKVSDIYRIISSNPKYSRLVNPVSKDIALEPEYIDDMIIRTSIHRTDTVTVIIGCSRNPITIDERGITRLSCALTRREERLSRRLDECGNILQGGYERIPIPDNRRWQVTLWHFGKDKFANEYPAQRYALTWGHGREVLRTYIKTLNDKKVKRKERQEYPKKSLEDALDDKRSEDKEVRKTKEEDSSDGSPLH
jgi:hypothetical protein